MTDAAESSGQGAPPRSRRSLGRDVLGMGGTKIFVLVLSMVGTIIVSRALGPDGRGVLAVAVGLQLILQQIGTLGLSIANPYFVAKDADSTARVSANSVWFSFVIGGPLILAGIGVKLVAPSAVEGVDWPELLVALAAVPGALGCMFLQSVLIGEGRVAAYNQIELVHAIAVTAGLGVVFLLGGGVFALLSLYAVLYYVTMAATAVILRRHGPVLARPDVGLARQMIGYAFRLYVTTLIGFLVIRLDILLVNAYRGSEEAGYYSLAAAIAEALYLLPSVIGVNLFPRIAEGAGADLTAVVFRMTFLAFGALVLLSAALAGFLIPAAFGDAFDDTVYLYHWLAPGIFCLGMLTVLSHHFAGIGFPLEAMLVWFIGLALNLAINFATLPTIGTVGASIGSSATYALLLVLHVRMFARESGYRALAPRPGELLRALHAAMPRRA